MCRHSVVTCVNVSWNHQSACSQLTQILTDFARRHEHDVVSSTEAVCLIFATKMKTSNNSSGVPTLQPPLSKSCYCTPHCLPVGATAGQSLSHLIMALKAKSNNIITLSVTDDWDLQRPCSASVPVHLTGQGCRLIKGLQNIVDQQPRFSDHSI